MAYKDLAMDFIDIAKQKGLTIRQTLDLFEYCKNYVLDSQFFTEQILDGHAFIQTLCDKIKETYPYIAD